MPYTASVSIASAALLIGSGSVRDRGIGLQLTISPVAGIISLLYLKFSNGSLLEFGSLKKRIVQRILRLQQINVVSEILG